MTLLRCPHCRHPLDMTDSEIYCAHTTYWADEEPVERECNKCSAHFYLKEHVRRTWSIGRTPDEADDVMTDDFDGMPPPAPRRDPAYPFEGETL